MYCCTESGELCATCVQLYAVRLYLLAVHVLDVHVYINIHVSCYVPSYTRMNVYTTKLLNC